MPRTLSDRAIRDFRGQLEEAATRRFLEGGLAAVTLRGLAEDVGCSRMTPYRYFANKGEILAAVRARAFSQLADATEAAARRANGPLEGLEARGRAYLQFAAQNPGAYRLMFEFSQPGEEDYPELAKQLARHRASMRASADAAVAAGVVAGDPDTVAQLFWAGMHGVVSLELAGKLTLGRSFGRLSKEMVRTLFRGMAPTRPPRSQTSRSRTPQSRTPQSRAPQKGRRK